MTDRGSYRPIYEAILHDPRFLALSPNARLTFYTLKIGLGPSGIDVVYRGALEVQTGLAEEVLGEVLGELLEGNWIAFEELARGVLLVWIREGLDNEPNMNLENAPKRKGVENHLKGLPKCKTVNDFCDRYGFPQRTSSIYQPPSNPGVAAAHQLVQGKTLDLAHVFDVLLPNGREKSLVMTKLEEVRMWANAGVARYQVEHPDYSEETE